MHRLEKRTDHPCAFVWLVEWNQQQQKRSRRRRRRRRRSLKIEQKQIFSSRKERERAKKDVLNLPMSWIKHISIDCFVERKEKSSFFILSSLSVSYLAHLLESLLTFTHVPCYSLTLFRRRWRRILIFMRMRRKKKRKQQQQQHCGWH